MGERKPDRKGFFLRAGTLDAREYGAVPYRRKRETKTDQRGRKSVGFRTARQTLGKASHSTEKDRRTHGGGTRIELFARQTAEGWDSWGNQVPEEGAPFAPPAESEEIDGQESIFDILKGDKRA